MGPEKVDSLMLVVRQSTAEESSAALAMASPSGGLMDMEDSHEGDNLPKPFKR